MTTMFVKKVPIENLIPDSVNARKHSERNVSAIVDSLKEFEQYSPLVVQKSTGRVLVGNGRLEAMKKLGWKEVNIVEYDCDNVTATRLALADNRTAELATWDHDILTNLIEQLDVENEPLPGWTAEELENILSPQASEDKEMFREFGEDIETTHTCPKCGYEW